MLATVAALKKLFALDRRKSVWDYGSATDFELLWTAVSPRTGVRTESLGEDVIVCWASTAGDKSVWPVSAARFLTPLDWAACVAVRSPGVRVTVIDLDPGSHRDLPAYRHYRELGCDRLPWLRVAQAGDLAGWGPPVEFMESSSCHAGSRPVPPESFIRAARSVLVEVGAEGDRHSIANLVGPLLLLSDPGPYLSLHRKALVSLMLNTGLLSQGESTIHEEAPFALGGGRHGFRIVLLDDQWFQGWARWVSERLGCTWLAQDCAMPDASRALDPVRVAAGRGVEVWAAADPQWLLERIRRTLPAAEQDGCDARFKLTLIPGAPDGIEILLLDLRLFPRGDQTRERQFLSEVVDLCSRLSSDQTRLPALPPEEIATVDTWLKGGTEADEIVRMTLLPRLLAHGDFSLPVVDAAEPEQLRFVIGGLLVGYPSAMDDGPLELHRRMEAEGLRWWPDRFGEPYVLKRGVRDEDLPGGIAHDPEDLLFTFLDCLNGMRAYGVCVEYRDAATLDDGDDVRAEWRGDNRHRLVLSTLLEIALFEVLPTIVGNDATLSVFVATRARASNEYRGGEATVQRLRELYGYDGGRTYFRSLSEASVLPVIQEILERRGGTPLCARLEHARGVMLAYPEFQLDKAAPGTAILLDEQARPIIWGLCPEWGLTRHQHYVADIVANLCRRTGGKFHWQSNISRLFEHGSYDVLDARLAVLLRAARALDSGDRSGAVLELGDIDSRRPFSRRSGAMLLLQRLARAIREDFTSQDLDLLARGIEAETLDEAGPTPAPVQRGTVATLLPDKGFGFIRPETGGDDCFFHLSTWRSATYPSRGELVEFSGGPARDGRMRALWVRALA